MAAIMVANMSDAEAVRLADLNYGYAFRLMGRHATGGSLHEEPGLVAAITGPIAWLNVAVADEKLGDPAGTISRAIDFYRAAGAPFVMRIRVGFDMETQRAMGELGMQKATQLPGMVLCPVGDVPPAPSSLKIVEWDAETLAAHNEVLATSFGMPLQLMNNLITLGLLNSPMRGYVGYVEGRPVTTSALIVSDGVAGVYNVGTLPEYRNRGLGEAMTWHAVREGMESGCLMGSLQASAMGQPVYARMGFRNIAPYETYILMPKPGTGAEAAH